MFIPKSDQIDKVGSTTGSVIKVFACVWWGWFDPIFITLRLILVVVLVLVSLAKQTDGVIRPVISVALSMLTSVGYS